MYRIIKEFVQGSIKKGPKPRFLGQSVIFVHVDLKLKNGKMEKKYKANLTKTDVYEACQFKNFNNFQGNASHARTMEFWKKKTVSVNVSMTCSTETGVNS
jgi:hypothetical protein